MADMFKSDDELSLTLEDSDDCVIGRSPSAELQAADAGPSNAQAPAASLSPAPAAKPLAAGLPSKAKPKPKKAAAQPTVQPSRVAIPKAAVQARFSCEQASPTAVLNCCLPATSHQVWLLA